MTVRTDEQLMFVGDDLAKTVWQSKYAQEGETHYDQMHLRMAKEFSRIEEKYRSKENLITATGDSYETLSEYGRNREHLTEERIYNLFKDFKYVIPQGSIMSSLGTDVIASLSNCWVAESPKDSYASILKTDAELAFYYKRRGGVGTDISNLRPAGTITNNTSKTSTGAVSFMHRFSNTTREVAMNGRRGALMLSIDINHPDVMDFIKVKRDGTSVTGANISVKLNNDFMKAVEADEDYILRFPCNISQKELESIVKTDLGFEDLPLDKLHKIRNQILENGNSIYLKRIKAKEYWDEIIKSAKNHAEPGLMYWDNINNYDPAAVYEEYRPTTSNPCGEQFLNPNDSCRLMALNLYSLVKNPFSEDASIDEKLAYEVCYEFTRLGDDLIDLELEYIERIINKIKNDPEEDDIKKPELDLWTRSYDKTKAGRRIGLGITALADMVAALGESYDSKKGMTHFENIMRIKMRAELDCLIDLAILRGSFDGWDREKEFPSLRDDGILFGNDFYRMLWEEFPEQSHRMYKFGRRSISWSTIAPTGSVSILTQTSSGCEPLFQPFYMRRKKINPSEQGVVVDFVDEVGDSWQEFPVLHPKFKEWITSYHPHFVEGDIPFMSKEDLQIAFEESPWHGSTANDIDWIKRVEIQAILQKYTTNAISSTINLPSTVTEREVSDIYFQGWKMGLKGQTVYVDGSRSGVLVNEPATELVTFNENHAPKRPKSLSCKVVRFNNNKEKWIAFVGLLDNKPYEVFTGKLENVDLPNSVEIGEIKKVKNDTGEKRYDFIYDDGVVENISGVITSDYWNYGKLISGMLRHGMPLHFVVDTIQSLTWDDDHINTWKAGIARALKKFIKDGKAVGLVCKDCGSDSIVFEEGCNKCISCGSSACG